MPNVCELRHFRDVSLYHTPSRGFQNSFSRTMEPDEETWSFSLYLTYCPGFCCGLLAALRCAAREEAIT